MFIYYIYIIIYIFKYIFLPCGNLSQSVAEELPAHCQTNSLNLTVQVAVKMCWCPAFVEFCSFKTNPQHFHTPQNVIFITHLCSSSSFHTAPLKEGL